MLRRIVLAVALGSPCFWAGSQRQLTPLDGPRSTAGQLDRYSSLASTSLATDSVGQWDVKTATGSQIGAKFRGNWYADRWSWGIGDKNGGLGNNHRFPETSNC